MTTTTRATIARRPRGQHPRKPPVQQLPGIKGSRLPEYLEAQEVRAILAAANNPRARLLMLFQWRAGLRVSEALAVQAADLSLESDQPTLRVRSGKGGHARIVPVHPELQNALTAVLQFADVVQGRSIIGVSRTTAWRWVQAGVDRAVAIMNLHQLGFITRKENVILLGPAGVGKTHLAIALAITAAERGRGSSPPRTRTRPAGFGLPFPRTIPRRRAPRTRLVPRCLGYLRFPGSLRSSLTLTKRGIYPSLPMGVASSSSARFTVPCETFMMRATRRIDGVSAYIRRLQR